MRKIFAKFLKTFCVNANEEKPKMIKLTLKAYVQRCLPTIFAKLVHSALFRHWLSKKLKIFKIQQLKVVTDLIPQRKNI